MTARSAFPKMCRSFDLHRSANENACHEVAAPLAEADWHFVISERCEEKKSESVERPGDPHLTSRSELEDASPATEFKLVAPDAAADDNFGWSVSVSGDTAVVGSPFDDDDGLASGAAYIFKQNPSVPSQWTFVKKLTAPDADSDDNFGRAVGISGDLVIVGALFDEDSASGAGSAYVFSRNLGGTENWGLAKKLLAPDASTGDQFGYSVAISQENAVVGSRFDDDDGSGSGSAYVFSRNTGGTDNWGMTKKLTASDGARGDNFGWSVAIDGELVVVTSPFDDDGGDATGSGYVFEEHHGGTANWGERAKLTASDAEDHDNFGRSASIYGSYVLVGAPFNDDAGSASGAAYVFGRDTGGTDNWGEVKKLLPSASAADDNFGEAVGISQDSAVVGSPFSDDPENASGSAFHFQRDLGGSDNWGELTRFQASDGSADDNFGRAVSSSAANSIVGSLYDDDAGDGSGSAYLFMVKSGDDLPHSKTPFDFDGDGRTDVSVFRPSPSSLFENPSPEGSVSQWWYLRSSDLGTRGLQFGSSSDLAVAADYTGDGKADIAFWRPSTGEWFILRSEDESFFAFPFGVNGDIPAPGDFDGDGIADPAVFRPSAGTWFIFRSSDQQVASVSFGVSVDKPIVADYDGDGKDDVAVFRPSVSQFWLLQSSLGVKAYQFGTLGDRTAVGDWTGDGRADVAFYRPTDSNWFVIRSEDDSFFSFPWGVSGDIPVPGDYDGDRITDPAVWRPTDRTWYILGSTNGFEAVLFGATGDIPLPSTVSAQ
ncbi:MAG TPA: FG-GAP-like repeat-containing protein [Aridibacter sp.]|nr:FG-GAP-like repeat-containing protein [Aridibacter sp.]